MSSQEPFSVSSSSRQESAASKNKSKEDKKWSTRNAFSVVSRREFYLLWLTRFGMVLLSQGISGFYKAYALKALGYRDDFLASVGAAAGIFNCFGRLLFGFLVDRISYRLVAASVQHLQVVMHS
jgi:predicted MFS family arabinose efflux permease